MYEYQAVWVLAGKKQYQVSVPLSHAVAFHIIPLAQATGSDGGQTQAQIDKQINDITNAAEKRINDTISNPDATLSDLLNALAIAQTIGDTEAEKILFDLIEKDILREMKTAITDTEKIHAFKHCELMMSDSSSCEPLRHDVQDIYVKMCRAKVVAKNLKNFGMQQMEMGACDQLAP